eukprot:615207-Hanusia_phi.AAC.3
MSSNAGSSSSPQGVVDRVIIAPRVRRESMDSQPIEVAIDLQVLEPLFSLRQEEAADTLGVCLTSLKSACRKLGIMRWPYKKGGAREVGKNENDEEEGEAEVGSSSMGAESEEACTRVHLNRDWLQWYLSSTDVDSVTYEPSGLVRETQQPKKQVPGIQR